MFVGDCLRVAILRLRSVALACGACVYVCDITKNRAATISTGAATHQVALWYDAHRPCRDIPESSLTNRCSTFPRPIRRRHLCHQRLARGGNPRVSRRIAAANRVDGARYFRAMDANGGHCEIAIAIRISRALLPYLRCLGPLPSRPNRRRPTRHLSITRARVPGAPQLLSLGGRIKDHSTVGREP